jgi:predicted transcriptional regulator of viral defense system
MTAVSVYAGDNEDLVVVWLWTEGQGVFSHETALMLHGLSDALPARAHMTLPEEWRSRRLRIPEGVIPYFAPVPESDWTWHGAVHVTTVSRTLIDCMNKPSQPDFVRDAYEEAADRGLIQRGSLPAVQRYLKQFYPYSKSRSGLRFRSSSALPPRFR